MTKHELWVLGFLAAACAVFAGGYVTGYLRSYRRGLTRGMNHQQRVWEEWLDGQQPQPVQQPDEYGWMEAGHPATQKAEYGGRHRA